MDMDSVKALVLLQPEWYHSFCDTCADKITDVSNVQRENIWTDLPKYFDLSPWNKLEDSEC
jgi:hypothetical protein